MKRLLLALLLVLFAVSPLWAAGSVSETWYANTDRSGGVIILTCTADAAAATYPSTATTKNIYGYVTKVVTNPDAVSPTDDYDITLSDSDGVDIMGGALANRDETNSEVAVPYFTDQAVYGASQVYGALTIAISNNAVISAVTVVTIYIMGDYR
jgi:hypothetical protein